MEKIPQKNEKIEKGEYKTLLGLEKRHLEHLVDGMVEAIDDEEFDVLVGDDASGRLPTLFLREIFVSRMKKKHPDLSDKEIGEKVKTFFVAGGRVEGNEDELRKFFQKIKPIVKKKVLFVTEHIFTGKSLIKMAEIMEDSGIPFAVASMSVNPEIEHRYNFEGSLFIEKLRERGLFFSGGFGDNPDIYDAKELSGVTKVDSENSFKSSRVHPTAHAFPVQIEALKKNLEKTKKDARIDVKRLAEEIEENIFPKR